MVRFLLIRLAQAIPIALGVTVVIFITVRVVPGDPVATLLGPTATPAAKAALTESYGLDQPIPVQYVKWLGKLVTGDAGFSIAHQVPALDYVWEAFGNTLLLSGFAILIAVLGGCALGVLSAYRRGTAMSSAASAFSLVAIATPPYTLSLIFIVYIATELGWLPSSGMSSTEGGGGFVDQLEHLILPGVAAAMVPLGIIARMVRSTMIDVASADFINSLRARGLSERAVLLHAFHNTLPSVLTIAGLQVGYLLGGVIFVEILFTWPGIGLAVYNAISQRDLPVIQAGVLLASMAFVVTTLIVDVLNAVIDPRLRR